ncbi:MAG: hypothetical protein QOC99_4067 [Acidobacteriota bacterium]|jgi:hypothetical protein|nr:hypothetical protein [Acidobacteriota bacterium]
MRKLDLKRTGVASAVVFSLFCLALVSNGRGQEVKANAPTKKCSNETPKGTYGFYGNGTFLPGNPDGETAGPYTTVGLIKFDGAGHFSVPSETETFNGQPAIDPPFTGTYTVNADCTFTAANQFGAALSGVIVADSEEIYLMATDPGVVLNFVLKRR